MKLDKMWDRIHGMSEQELERFAAEHRVDVQTQEFDDQAHAARWVCEQLGIEKPDDQNDDPGSELDQLARRYQREHPDLSYEQCLGAMRKRHPELARRYAAKFGAVNRPGRQVNS